MKLWPGSRRAATALLLLLLAALPATTLPAAGGALTLDEAVALVRAQGAGRVVDSRSRRTVDGRLVHEVRVLRPDGRVRTFRVDAATGRIE
ncbi:MAG: PepSY domain-containing protein [Chromatiales bacterium]|nr:PepSY domain-containing protein [Chromatiales bacterium]